jgi:hypothetical protein
LKNRLNGTEKTKKVTKKKKAKKPRQLSAPELQEFRLRLNALQTAKATQVMVEEAYTAWLESVRKQYRIRGKFTVDKATGLLKSHG